MHAHTPTLATCTVTQKKQRRKKNNPRFSPKKYMQHPSGAAGSYSRSLPACPSSIRPACCRMCGWAFCRAWPLSPVLSPARDVPAPLTRVLVIFLLPVRMISMISMLTCCKGGAEGGARQNPPHGALGASPPLGGFERGLGTAR